MSQLMEEGVVFQKEVFDVICHAPLLVVVGNTDFQFPFVPGNFKSALILNPAGDFPRQIHPFLRLFLELTIAIQPTTKSLSFFVQHRDRILVGALPGVNFPLARRVGENRLWFYQGWPDREFNPPMILAGSSGSQEPDFPASGSGLFGATLRLTADTPQ